MPQHKWQEGQKFWDTQENCVLTVERLWDRRYLKPRVWHLLCYTLRGPKSQEHPKGKAFSRSEEVMLQQIEKGVLEKR